MKLPLKRRAQVFPASQACAALVQQRGFLEIISSSTHYQHLNPDSQQSLVLLIPSAICSESCTLSSTFYQGFETKAQCRGCHINEIT